MKSQRGGLAMNLGLIFMLVIIGALAMMLIRGDKRDSDTTFGIASPTISNNIPAPQDNGEFSDGLGAPNSVTHGMLDDFGAGIESVAQFNRDINQDGKMDRITRTHVATGNDHDYDEYKIELNNNGKMIDITPKGFRTTHGADCALRLIQFHFAPTFGATIISRPFVDTWDTPSVATKTEYSLDKDQFTHGQARQLSSVCDVTTLF